MNQEKIKNKINNLSELPHSILLLGPKGAGHLDICDYIANRFGLQSLNISELISNEFIESIYGNPNKTLYMIDISFLDERKQNSILKLYEQPNSLTYIILYGENDSTLLNTIITIYFFRAFEVKMKKKSKIVQCFSMVSQFALYMLVPIFICFGLGYYIDSAFGTHIFSIIFFFIGAISGFWSIVKFVTKIQSLDQDTKSYEYLRKQLRENKSANK